MTSYGVEERLDGVGSAEDDKRYVVVNIQISAFAGDEVTVGRSQWTLISFAGDEYSPDKATDEIEDGCPKQDILHADSQDCTIVWEVPDWNFPEFKVTPHGDQSGETVYFTSD
ncbi:hypothetical protein [Salinigranum halophilum]|uniref:hypothetical protein n=1 Tax=Salinigranum halophilum TaxID=2565931 RepID=UPI00137594A9|nr:hypothetical protein [Salinigranum halophilum]